MEKSTPTQLEIEAAAEYLPWYYVGRTSRRPRPDAPNWMDIADNSIVALGPNLLWDFLAEQRALPFQPGCWIVCSWIPATDRDLPDWGTLTVRGPGSWVLRSRDGRQAWAAGRQGTLICLQNGRAES